jgi:LysM repeat protein
LARWAAILVVAIATSVGLALAVHGATAPLGGTIVVQPGDTLWSIASLRYPSDDVRSRVDQIEQANGLSSPVIVVGESLRLPAA